MSQLIFPQVRDPDFVTPLLRAQQIKTMQAQRQNYLQQADMEARKFEREAQSNALLGAALRGDTAAQEGLAQLDPQGFIRFQQHQQSYVENQRKSEDDERTRAVEAFRVAGNALGFLSKQEFGNAQRLYPGVKQSLTTLDKRFAQLPDTLESQEQLADWNQQYQAVIRSTQSPAKLSQEGVAYAEATGQRPDDPNLPLDPQFQAHRARQNVADAQMVQARTIGAARGNAPNINITNTPVSPPTGATKSHLQKTIFDAQTRLSPLEKALNHPDFLKHFTLGSKVKTSLIQGAARAGLPIGTGAQAYLKSHNSIMGPIQREAIAYNHANFGASLTAREQAMAWGAVLDKNLDPYTAYELGRQAIENQRRIIRLAKRILREGIPLGTDAASQALDAYWADGVSGASEADTRAYIEELEAQGLNEKQIERRLDIEGYLEPGDVQ